MAGGDRKNAAPVLIAALASGATHLDAARQAGIGEKTVYRRLEDRDFRRRVTKARSAMVAPAVGTLEHPEQD